MTTVLRRFGLWIAVGAFVLGGYLFRDFLSSSAQDLRVGDCFDIPAAATTAAYVEDVQHHPCTEPHDGEVVFLGRMSGADDAYPADDAFVAFADTHCVPAYRSYTGRDYEEDVTYDMPYLIPTSEGWAKGDRDVACYVVRADRQPGTGSVKGAR